MTDGKTVPKPGPEESRRKQKVPKAVAAAAKGAQEGIPDPKPQPHGKGDQKTAGCLGR